MWFLNAPVLSEDTIDHCKEWVDFITSARLPDLTKNPKLFELIKMYQLHRQSKTGRKYKNRFCRFNFGRYFTEKTIIAKPLPSSLKDHEKADIMVERNRILTKVKEYIDKELDPAKVNFYDRTKEDFAKTKSITEILQELETEVEYQNALSVSSDDDYELHLQRPPDSCFVNNYFESDILAWEANIDIEPVINHYKAVSYMCAYLSKTEDEFSHAMNQAVKRLGKTSQIIMIK